MSILWTIIIGFVAGIIAKLITPGRNEPSGFILTTILGIIGAFVATYLGQAVGWRGTIHRPGVAGTIYVFAVGQAIVYAAVLGPPELEAEVDETASLLARAQEQRLPRA